MEELNSHHSDDETFVDQSNKIKEIMTRPDGESVYDTELTDKNAAPEIGSKEWLDKKLTKKTPKDQLDSDYDSDNLGNGAEESDDQVSDNEDADINKDIKDIDNARITQEENSDSDEWANDKSKTDDKTGKVIAKVDGLKITKKDKKSKKDKKNKDNKKRRTPSKTPGKTSSKSKGG